MQGVEKAEEIWVVLCRDVDGTEGIPAVNVDGHPMPMVAVEPHIAAYFQDRIPDLAKQAPGTTWTLNVFSTREILQTWET